MTAFRLSAGRQLIACRHPFAGQLGRPTDRSTSTKHAYNNKAQVRAVQVRAGSGYGRPRYGRAVGARQLDAWHTEPGLDGGVFVRLLTNM